ncbi:MAG: hypothetical protein V1767_09715 [Chloroflexota bacterium]
MTISAIKSQEEEPPGSRLPSDNEAEEPPSSLAATRESGFFVNCTREDWNDWRWHFRNRITSVEELTKFIHLSPQEQAQLKLVTIKYPLSITPYYFSLIDRDDPDDPIRKQAIPSFQEIAQGNIGFEDPLEEKRDSVVPGLVHRYPDRVLMVLTDICPMLCRHCTRKREWRHGGWIHTKEEIEACWITFAGLRLSVM